MSENIIHTEAFKAFIAVSCGINADGGDARFKAIMNRMMSDLCGLIEEFAISDEEFWRAVNYLNVLGERKEVALLAAGLGLEHFLDMRADATEAAAGHTGGTPRTIEGPLYVANAPLSQRHARMDDGKDPGEPMWLCGQVTDQHGRPLAGAIVDIWHANTHGCYSFFDPSQPPYNLRRRIETAEDGRYAVRSILPSGYGCPLDGPTQALLNHLGRHGNRPAHIHFFVSAPGHRHLTTQINLNGDEWLWDDFAFATREELIADPVNVTDRHIARERDMPVPHTEIRFDFKLLPAESEREIEKVKRARMLE
ncbi:catechol 1,2-dioxygenase [Erwinia sp. ErVv1]|uniref:catechol 1,2-dioxygenase n=1 Tax=Erwinia sp. ErVv1 TaxID=1603299 RepID=UPI000A3E4E50|nr:catechol 1,2-dioxygenase [Erwinia sp. ErVv1]